MFLFCCPAAQNKPPLYGALIWSGGSRNTVGFCFCTAELNLQARTLFWCRWPHRKARATLTPGFICPFTPRCILRTKQAVTPQSVLAVSFSSVCPHFCFRAEARSFKISPRFDHITPSLPDGGFIRIIAVFHYLLSTISQMLLFVDMNLNLYLICCFQKLKVSVPFRLI